MPIFALPLPPNSALPSSRTHLSSLPTRKRKRPPSRSPSPDAEPHDHATDLPAASTNPLSLTPAEIAQYRLAGLRLDEQIPGKGLGFPHRGLPSPISFSETTSRAKKDRKGKGRAVDFDGDVHVEEDRNEREEREKGRERKERGPGLRGQHLAVLVAILQRCLQEGDIARAGRAWSMLIRAQVGGQAVDIRGSGYWGIGAELLVRSLDRKSTARGEEDDEDQDGEREGEERGERRWGTKEGLEKARDYYERLILQHPYKRQFHGSVTALDFWPAMVGCEIYGIQWEWKEGLRDLERREGWDGSGDASEDSVEEEDEEVEEETREIRRRQRREEKFWQERDGIRLTALVASGKIAARLDELMTTPPYSDSHVLLRLRGMLALYIGDLSVPQKPVEDGDDYEDDEALGRNRISEKDTERRFLLRQRLAEHERGKEKQSDERDRAKKLFDRIGDEGAGANLGGLDEDEDHDELYDAED